MDTLLRGYVHYPCHFLEEKAHGRGLLGRQLRGDQASNGAAKRMHRIMGIEHACVSGRTVGCQQAPDDPLFGCANQISPSPRGDIEAEPADLADGLSAGGEELRVLPNYVACA